MPGTDEIEVLHRAQREVERKDRKYHFRTYEDCFLGSLTQSPHHGLCEF